MFAEPKFQFIIGRPAFANMYSVVQIYFQQARICPPYSVLCYPNYFDLYITHHAFLSSVVVDGDSKGITNLHDRHRIHNSDEMSPHISKYDILCVTGHEKIDSSRKVRCLRLWWNNIAAFTVSRPAWKTRVKGIKLSKARNSSQIIFKLLNARF